MHVYSPPLSPYLDVVYEDEHLLVADKQSGLLTVPGRGPEKQDCLVSRVAETRPGANAVHRLDMETSGLVVIALNKESHGRISRQFQERKVWKRYTAWIAGTPMEREGRIDLPLICDWPNRPRQMVDHDIGKTAITDWQVEETHADRTRVTLKPVTGRSHQLRVHMMELGHPILGDRLYAPDDIQALSPRLMLHADALTFRHPATGQELQFTAPSTLLPNGPSETPNA
ncbi:pseudouridine synthase [Sneathiella chinensis]|uniref:Dual-specificity RNA pseudouridine synthase RluA n=1 Tax=Sneathiella chinensis TaxID=349750 RepID=A0ABQ5U5K9_9PROT|nr:pseudouridine synthase [Sneathiella chinensis]GLQ06965.1 pseudouridine synthase [Sneathiella chinensis]